MFHCPPVADLRRVKQCESMFCARPFRPTSTAAAAGLILAALLAAAPALGQTRTMPACRALDPPPDCGRQRMMALEMTVTVPPGPAGGPEKPGCMDETTDALRGMMITGGASVPDNEDVFGPRIMAGIACTPLIAPLPPEAAVLAPRLWAAEMDGNFRPCLPAADCGIDGAGFEDEVLIQGGRAMKAATAVFINRSDRPRRARLQIFYTLYPPR